jgi:hypothetical protein
VAGFQKNKWIALLFLLTSCYKGHLYVQQEWIEKEWLASSRVLTPDPRQENPPQGQRLLIAWDFPKSLFQQGLTVQATVRLWDNTQTVHTYPIERKRSFTSFFFPHRPETDDRILTYKVQVINQEGKIVETWEHQFWTELIQINPHPL